MNWNPGKEEASYRTEREDSEKTGTDELWFCCCRDALGNVNEPDLKGSECQSGQLVWIFARANL